MIKKETAALTEILDILEQLEPGQRCRILKYARAWADDQDDGDLGLSAFPLVEKLKAHSPG